MMDYPDIDNLGKYKEFVEVIKDNSFLESYYGMKYYQALPVRYFKPYNKKIKRFLIYHSPGSGKSFIALWIIKNFLEEFHKKAIILVKNKETIMEFQQRVALWYKYNYTDYDHPNSYHEFIDKYIEFKTYYQFCNSICVTNDKHANFKNPKELLEIYDKRLIIIDEFHHFRSKDENSDKKMYRILSQVLSMIKNSRVVFLSATPIFDNSDEIDNLINFINPEVNVKNVYPNDIYSLLKGRISYFSSENIIVKQCYMGEKIPEISKKIVKIPMIGKQLEAYEGIKDENNAYGFDFVKASLGYLDKEFDGNFQETEKIDTNKYICDDDKIVNLNPDIQNFLENCSQDLSQYNCKLNYFLEQINSKNPINGPVFIFCNLIDGTGINYISALLSSLGYHYITDYSSLQRVQKKKETFLKNHEKFKNNDNDDENHNEDNHSNQFMNEANLKKKNIFKSNHWNFTFVSGDKRLCPNLNERLNIFNSRDNSHGELIKILIGSEVVSEAVDIKNVRQVHIFTPHWNYERINQVIGRTCRINTHNHLPPEERMVQIYFYMAYNPNIPCQNNAKYSIDYKKLCISESKKKYSDSIIQYIQESSIESIIKKNLKKNFSYSSVGGSSYSSVYNTYIKNNLISLILSNLKELFNKGYTTIDLLDLTDQCKKFPYDIVVMVIRYLCNQNAYFAINNVPHLLRM
eukprot:jgi/Orpsp1_1/1190309/evm.model.d7180000078174.1